MNQFGMSGWALLGLVLVLTGCATPLLPMREAAAPSVPRVAPPAGQGPLRMPLEALERWQDEVGLWHLARVRDLRKEAYGRQVAVRGAIGQRMAAGLSRGTDAELANAALVEDEIQLRRADLQHRAATLRFCQRHGPAGNTDALPQVVEGASASAGQAGEPEDEAATVEALQQALMFAALHEQRARALATVATVFRQQFEVGQRSLGELRGSEEAMVDASLQAVLARAEAALAEGRLALLRGRLPATAPSSPTGCVLPPALDLAALPRVAPPSAGATPPPATPGTPAAPPTTARAAPAKPATVLPNEGSQPRGPSAKAAPSGQIDDSLEFEAPAAGPSQAAGADLRRTRSSALNCSNVGADAVGTSADGWPAFDWPPPAPTTTVALSPRLVGPIGGSGALSGVAERLARVLQELGYPASFLSVPEGFALLTRMERILDDGSTSGDPWSRDLPRVGELGFGDFVRALFRAPPGRYRVIAFVVSNAPRGTGRAPLAEGRFDALLCAGFNRPPPALAKLVYVSGTTQADALVYEFTKQKADMPASFLQNTSIPAAEHLRLAGITDALQRAD